MPQRFLQMAFVYLLLVTGCAMQCNRSSLPDGRYRVGGGFSVNYQAPEAGTVIWANVANGQILATQSLQPGERFVEAIAPDDEGARELLGGDYYRARLVLYFVPAQSRAHSP